MDGLQLLKEIKDINQRLNLISNIIEQPIYKGSLGEDNLHKEITEFLGRSNKLKQQIINLKYIKI